MNAGSFSPSMFIGVEGKGVISFGSGQPDLPPPKQVFDMLPSFKAFKYGLIQGQVNLRRALARQYPRSTAKSFVVTNGASEALDLTLRVLSEHGSGNGKKRKVLLPRPYYYSYPFNVKYAGMEPVYTKLVEGRIDFDDFASKVHDCTAVIINSPSNPTGRVESISTLRKIEKLASDLGVFVISDEVYKDLIYVRENYLIKGPHVVTINSFSKTFAMCGFRVGYLWSLDNEFVKAVIEMKTHSSMNTNILGQEMAYEATKVPRSFIDDQLKIWKERRDLIYEGLSDLGLDLWKPEGAFYVLPKVEKPVDFVLGVFKRYKVITYMGEWFGADERVRFSYALDSEKIEEGLKRVARFLEGRK
ncbi:MAG: aminotransferase class I/II-fold pyridoxal phosphate-dependent enzyme [Candidatus Aenigmarchaeota archaeon]|nr:aminotransferase class I/II-fold pyridoxal phosphate-dependent enzyme [Candidatus Aenigmarchaeota archaeon]